MGDSGVRGVVTTVKAEPVVCCSALSAGCWILEIVGAAKWEGRNWQYGGGSGSVRQYELQ